MSENKFSRAKAAARKRVSKAERERRKYIRETAETVGSTVIQFLADREFQNAVDRIEAVETERLRNDGAVALARLLATYSDERIPHIVREVAQCAAGGSSLEIGLCLECEGRRVFPLPPKEGE